MEIQIEKYYALYDLQLDGFKAGFASNIYEEVVKSGAERAYTLSQSDDEPASEDMTDKEILKEYGYEVREVSKQEYEKVLNSNEHGLLTTVRM